MSLGEFVDRITMLTGLSAKDAMLVAGELYVDESTPEPTQRGVQYAVSMLGLASEPEPAPVPAAPPTLEERLSEALRSNHLEPDPAKVLMHVYRGCPRALTVKEPVIGRVPKDSVFHTTELTELLDQLDDDVRLLIGSIDMHNGEASITMYDEANDLDRTIGPIAIDEFGGIEQLQDAVDKLLARLPRVLAADLN